MSDLFSKVGIDLGVVVLLLIVLIIVMMIMTVSMSLRLSRLNQKYRSFMKGKDAQSLEKLFHQRFKEIDKLNKQNLWYNNSKVCQDLPFISALGVLGLI